jgi:hypothetical protein
VVGPLNLYNHGLFGPFADMNYVFGGVELFVYFTCSIYLFDQFELFV